MFENTETAQLASTIFKTTNLYSRVTLFESFYSKNLKAIAENTDKPDAAMASLGVLVYAEYYGSKRLAPDAKRRVIIGRLLKHFAEEPFGLPFVNVKDKDLMSMPDLSAGALDFILDFDEISHFTAKNGQHSLSTIMYARIVASTTPDEVILVWANMLEKKKGLVTPLVANDDKSNITYLFENLCLDRIEVTSRLVRDAKLTPQGVRLFKALLDKNYDFTILRRSFLNVVIGQASSSDEPLNLIVTSLLANQDVKDTRLFFDLAAILDPIGFQACRPSTKVGLTDAVLSEVLKSENTQASLEDKKQLFMKTAQLLSDDQLFVLATGYASQNWNMFTTIRSLANPPARSLDNHPWFDAKERETTEQHNTTWPLCFQKLDGIISKYEASIAPKEGGFGRYMKLPEMSMNTLASIPTMATVNSAFGAIATAPSMITGHDAHREALKELYPLFEKGTALPEKPTSSLLSLFIKDFKTEYPNMQELSLDVLPVTLRDRLETLKPGIIVPVQPVASSTTNNDVKQQKIV